MGHFSLIREVAEPRQYTLTLWKRKYRRGDFQSPRSAPFCRLLRHARVAVRCPTSLLKTPELIVVKVIVQKTFLTAPSTLVRGWTGTELSWLASLNCM
ncbi:hypothetical protein SK128_009199 [Halocaridina rubra]|uniref:Uncharacterized protein n=1 Tax=Halocaridina rubra TaxID=373956 RepID=A0AAN8ZW59_HALRR